MELPKTLITQYGLNNLNDAQSVGDLIRNLTANLMSTTTTKLVKSEGFYALTVTIGLLDVTGILISLTVPRSILEDLGQGLLYQHANEKREQENQNAPRNT